MEIGRVCIKTKGREAGQKVVVLSDVKSGKVLVDGEKVKRKECKKKFFFTNLKNCINFYLLSNIVPFN